MLKLWSLANFYSFSCWGLINSHSQSWSQTEGEKKLSSNLSALYLEQFGMAELQKLQEAATNSVTVVFYTYRRHASWWLLFFEATYIYNPQWIHSLFLDIRCDPFCSQDGMRYFTWWFNEHNLIKRVQVSTFTTQKFLASPYVWRWCKHLLDALKHK